MKLTTKLSLAFSALIGVFIIVGCISLNSLNVLQQEKELLALAENIRTRVLNMQSNASKAIAEENPEPVKIIRNELTSMSKEITGISGIAKYPETFAALEEIKKSQEELGSVLDSIAQSFTTISNIDKEITQVGQATFTGFQKLDKSMQSSSSYTFNDLMDAKIVEGRFMDMRVAACSLLLVMNDTNQKLMQDAINEMKNAINTQGQNQHLAPFMANINQYIKATENLIQGKLDQKTLLETGDTYIAHALSATDKLVKIAHTQFGIAKNTADYSLYISTLVAILIGVILTIFLTRGLHKQLGADPAELKALAQKVTDGNYDIDDNVPHTGVYQNIISMVNTMKEALQFTRNILSSLPIPCAVFGPDNRLKFANREMLNLIETSQKMEDCIGQSSGQFLFRQENYNTATLKAINTKQQGRSTIEYLTYKNNKLHIDAIAEPLTDASGNITNVISVWNNITEQTLQAQTIAQAHQHMQEVARELEQVATIASSASEQLSSQIELSEQGAQDQAERVASTATALEEMNATVLEIARNAGTTSDSAASVRSEASAGSESMQECVKAMQGVREESLKLQTEMGVLSDHAQAINEIMNVISDIADQTNLLALNAAIEAARAGDAGRGFAVVADEVRNLAEKTMTSTTDVGNAITAIQRSTADNTRLVIDTVEKIEKVTEMVSHAGEALLGIVQLADTTADQVRAIATASEEQSATSDEITQSVDSINNIAKENANNMQEARQAVAEVVNQTNVLSNLINELQNSTK